LSALSTPFYILSYKASSSFNYLGYPEVINITKLKPSALLTALNYMP